ncbi:hypothetical protein ABH940_002289 [Streptacidiphilus sp. BW17]|uniref:hypothetical protein n=1 Tax=Streptacidiphilus sp. BW17 TaxID=3156274 RepID=UPI003517E031
MAGQEYAETCGIERWRGVAYCPGDPGAPYYERTGIGVRVDRLTGVYKNVARGVVALVFLCHPEGGQAQLSDESTAVEWLIPAEVINRMGTVFAIRVLDAIAEGESAVIRTHDGRVILD